mmetsp:Transcript_9875/g.14278  ORF Transcript_9875/g.14278 Transcript_9875/m.14278 type:complete len:112 (+) Transcript_9875:275-610(+)
MMDRYLSGEGDVKPNTISFTSVIDAWANSGDKRGPSRAEQIMRKMDELSKLGDQDLRPNTKTFNAVINAYVKSGDKGSTSKVKQLLAEMEQRSKKENNLKPNTVTHIQYCH